MKKFGKFIMGVKREMKKVRWPNKKELLKYSIAILACITIIGVFFVISDFIIAVLLKFLGGLS